MHRTPPSAPHRRPIRTAADLRRSWQAVIGTDPPARRSLWLLIIDGDDRSLGLTARLDDIPLHPSRTMLGNLMVVATRLPTADGLGLPGATVAFLLGRPGPAAPTASDRTWARGLDGHTAKAGVRSHPLGIAGDDGIVLLDGPVGATAA